MYEHILNILINTWRCSTFKRCSRSQPPRRTLPRPKLQRRRHTSRRSSGQLSELEVRILVAFQVQLSTTDVYKVFGEHTFGILWFVSVHTSSHLCWGLPPGLKASDRVSCVHTKERAHGAIFGADLVIYVVCKLWNQPHFWRSPFFLGKWPHWFVQCQWLLVGPPWYALASHTLILYRTVHLIWASCFDRSVGAWSSFLSGIAGENPPVNQTSNVPVHLLMIFSTANRGLFQCFWPFCLYIFRLRWQFHQHFQRQIYQI